MSCYSKKFKNNIYIMFSHIPRFITSLN
uniref:Uncharacterized protein n=1 Tax=Anguilla anguilla TaxID=7936 RepID=A0A0E9TKV5_ANGAN